MLYEVITNLRIVLHLLKAGVHKSGNALIGQVGVIPRMSQQGSGHDHHTHINRYENKQKPKNSFQQGHRSNYFSGASRGVRQEAIAIIRIRSLNHMYPGIDNQVNPIDLLRAGGQVLHRISHFVRG